LSHVKAIARRAAHHDRMSENTIPIRVLDAAATKGCGACMHTSVGPVCRTEYGHACASPDLHGPEDQVQRVMQALSVALAANGDDASQLVHSLKIADGEASLELAVAPHCAGAQLVDLAFQTLRGLLPDTDIYVSHAA
jgi:hypothetical protein